MRKIFTISLTAIIAGNASSQSRPESGLWTAINLHINFSKQWQWHNDGGYRTLGLSLKPLQYLYRTGIRYSVNKHWTFVGGVAFFFTKTNFLKSDDEFGNEFRFWEEVLHQKPLNEKLQLLLRLRTEQRFFSTTSVKDKYTGYRFRLRPGLNQRINDKWSVQLTNEYMRQAANQKFSFDQNRLTFSGICQFDKSSQLQAGYLWLKWPKGSQHIMTFTFTKNIWFNGNSNN